MTVRRRHKKLAKPKHKAVPKVHHKAPPKPKKLHDHHAKKIPKITLHEAHAANTVLKY